MRIFDAAGDPMVSFGNQGQGPGEFGVSGGSRPIPAAWILGVGDGVGLIDLFPPTLEIFDGEGAFVEQHRLDIPPVPMEQAFNATSRVYLRMGFDPTGGAGPAVHRCVLDLAAGVSCSVAQSLDQIAEAAQQDGAPAADPRAFAIAASPNGDLLLADPLGYRIWAVNEAGEIIMETGRDIPRRAKTEEQIAAERARMPAARADIEIEPLHPHLEYSGLDIDGAGRIWALTTRWTDTDSVFDVFAADGAYLGEAVADALIRRGSGSWAVAPFFLEGNRLASVVQLPDGSEQVRVWRIVEGRP